MRTLTVVCSNGFVTCRALPSSARKLYSTVFFGSDQFSKRVLQTLMTYRQRPACKVQFTDMMIVSSASGGHKHGKNLVGLLQQFASEQGQSVHLWQGNPHLIAQLNSTNFGHLYDVGIVASFGRRLSLELMDCFPRGIINVHASLLPRWRGAAPIQHTILSRDRQTGVTLMQLETEAYDEGRVLAQRTMEVPENVTFNQMSKELAQMGGEMVVDVLTDLDRYQSHSYSQNYKEATNAPKIPQHWEQISFTNASNVDCKFRAFGHQFGGLVCKTQDGRRVHFTDLQLNPDDLIPPLLTPFLGNGLIDVTAGTGFFRRNWDGILVRCHEGWLLVKKAKMEYRDVITARDFANAYMKKTNIQGLKTIRFLEIS